jgi:hypothetical protein
MRFAVYIASALMLGTPSLADEAIPYSRLNCLTDRAWDFVFGNDANLSYAQAISIAATSCEVSLDATRGVFAGIVNQRVR